ncbi:MAG: hypothetical protein KQH53_19260 [Desulfarculaceae bacterium]|nr:hypothetical protein [Desulfarculaceae bacterium]
MHLTPLLQQPLSAAASQSAAGPASALSPDGLGWLVSPLMIVFWIILALFGLGLFHWARRAYLRGQEPWPPSGP